MPLTKAYIVREHFKAGGKFFPAGKVLSEEEASTIPLLKVRVGEKKLIRLDIPQQQILNLCTWIQARYGVDAKASMREYVTSLSAGKEQAPPVTPTPGTKAPKK